MAGKINIAKYIFGLLQKEGVATIPGLGKFILKNTSAQIDEFTKEVIPPGKIIDFIESDSFGDSKLIDAIAVLENFPTYAVEESIESFVTDLKTRISSGDTVKLEGIGQFNFLGGGNLNFTSHNLAIDSNHYGLDKVDLPEKSFASSTAAPSAFTKTPEESIAEPIHEASNLGSAPILEDTSPRERRTVSEVLAGNAQVANNYNEAPPIIKEKAKTPTWKWLLPILILFLFLSLLYQLFGGKWNSQDSNLQSSNPQEQINKESTNPEKKSGLAYNNESDSKETNEVNTNSKDPIQKEETNTDVIAGKQNIIAENEKKSSTSKAEAESQKSRATSDIKKAPPKSTEGSKPKNTSSSQGSTTNTKGLGGIKVTDSKNNEYVQSSANKGFYIIVGAFKSKSNAEKLAAKIAKAGNKSEVLETTKGYYRTGLYVGNNETEVSNLYQLARKKYNKSAWILNYK